MKPKPNVKRKVIELRLKVQVANEFQEDCVHGMLGAIGVACQTQIKSQHKKNSVEWSVEISTPNKKKL